MKIGSMTTYSEDADVINNLATKESLIVDMNYERRKNLDNSGFSESSLTPSEESFEEQNIKANSFNNETKLVRVIDSSQEIDQEETELDVESVLAKQNTHDLYCPNCEIRITRSVILRRIRLDAGSTNSANVDGHENDDVHSSDRPAFVASDLNNGGEPERCLSCLSFLIPVGDAIKSSWPFGPGSGNANGLNLQKPNSTIVGTGTAEPVSPIAGGAPITTGVNVNPGNVEDPTASQIQTGVTVDILKSIVYGGLIESITSLGVVSSAAGAGSATLNILALGLANLVGGLFIIGNNLIELKNYTADGTDQMNRNEDRYKETLGRPENFPLHATVAVLSFLIFGMLSPVIYSFSFRKSDDKDLKLAVVGGVSLVCILLLAIGKAHVRRPPKSYYISTALSYVISGIMASGISYVVGDLISKLLEKVGWFESSLAVSTIVPERKPIELAWASY